LPLPTVANTFTTLTSVEKVLSCCAPCCANAEEEAHRDAAVMSQSRRDTKPPGYTISYTDVPATDWFTSEYGGMGRLRSGPPGRHFRG
jgi:hypothetical protein